jgi:tetratricopeptide (TPR) repeat protein
MNLLLKAKINFIFLIFTGLTGMLVSCGPSAEEKKEISKDVFVNTILGLGYLEDNDLEVAEIAFLRVIELAPDESTGYANLGLVYLRMGRNEEAQQQLLKAIDLEDDKPDIRLTLAKTYEMNQQQDKAIEQLRYILAIDPNHVKTLYELTQQYLLQDDPQRAEYLQRLIEVLPGNIVVKLELIEFYLKNEKADEALEILEELQQQFPEFPVESVQYYQSAIDILQTSSAGEAMTPFIMFHNYMKTSTIFQAGMAEFEGPGENLNGFPIIAYDPMILWNVAEEAKSIVEMMSFKDITSSIGLDVNNKYASLVVTDFDGDGDNDVYLGGADASGVPRLYRNNFGHYEEITQEAGLTHSGNEYSSLFSDFDNDGFLDLFIIKADEYILYHNNGQGNFENVAEQAQLPKSRGGNKAVFFDLDHEGDLDLLIVGNGNIEVFRNNGDKTFFDYTAKSGIVVQPEFNGVEVSFGDFNGDGTTDFVVANENGNNALYKNLRHGRFEDIVQTGNVSIGTGASRLTAGDYNNDGFLDLLLTNKAGNLELHQNQRDGNFARDNKVENSLMQKNAKAIDALFLDFDNDGLQDIISIWKFEDSTNGVVRLYHNDGTGNFRETSRLLPKDLIAKDIVPFDFDDDGDLDLFILSDTGIRLLRNEGGNINHYLKINLIGLRTGSSKNNHFGIGSKVEVRSGDRYQMKTVTEPVTYFGLGSRPVAEVVRIQWTNGVPQNIYFPEGNATALEKQLLKGSCPFLYTWDGEKYVFVKDILWRSALGMPLGIMAESATYAFADAAQEYVKIPGEMLKQRDGTYDLQITSELWETIYIDKLELVVIDHPASFEVFVDEKFTPPPYPEHKIFKVANEKVPVRATDGKGNDLTKLISKKDDKYVANFELQKFQGVTENTVLELDLGESINTENLSLFMNGWIFPSDASINIAISQGNEIQMNPPQLQIINAAGEWQTVDIQIGFPMGKRKTIIIDLSDVFLTDDYRLRIQTNMQIYWDYIFFANVDSALPMQTTNLTVKTADLHYRGYSAMERKGGRYGPHWFDYSSVSTGQKWRDLTGQYTRYGDVQPLLTQADDMYVINNSGDEITIKFDASKVQELPDGWKRDFLIYSEGWVKDGDLNTAFGNTVEPLPFHGMSEYPYDPIIERFPTDSLHRAYQKQYNNRTVNTSEYNQTVIEY